MAGIFPPPLQGGVPPGTTGLCNGYLPNNPVIGEGPHFIAPDCSTLLTDCQLNAITSEILAAVDLVGCSYNAGRVDNLGTCLNARFVAIEVRLNDLQNQINNLDIPAGGIQHAPSNGQWYASRNGAWQAFDPGGGGIPEAPLDGLLYGRQNGQWRVIVSGGGGQPDGSPDGSTISGLQFNGSTGTSFSVTAGSCWAEDGSVANNGLSVMRLAAQSAVNMVTVLDAGSVTANTWYHCFVIANVNFGAVRLLLSTSVTPLMPGGYVRRRRIFTMFVDSGGAIRPMVQRGDIFLWEEPQQDALFVQAPVWNGPGTPGYYVTLSIPPLLVETLTSINPAAAGFLSSSLTSDVYPEKTAFSDDIRGNANFPYVRILTNDRQVRFRHYGVGGGSSSTEYHILTRGWIDRRGQDDIPLNDWATVGWVQTNYLPLAGGTMEGPLIAFRDPVDDMEVVTKRYIDNLIAGLGGGNLGGNSIVGLEYQNGTEYERFSVSAGSCVADDGSGVITLPAYSNVVPSSVVDSGGLGADAWLHCFAIARADFTTPRLLLSQSITPAMPSAYTKRRRIFSIYRWWNNPYRWEIKEMIQHGDWFFYSAPTRDADLVMPGGGQQLVVLSLPPVEVVGQVSVRLDSGAGAGVRPWRIVGQFQPVILPDTTAGRGSANCMDDGAYALQILTFNSRVMITTGFGNANVLINTLGFVDRRGKDSIPITGAA